MMASNSDKIQYSTLFNSLLKPQTQFSGSLRTPTAATPPSLPASYGSHRPSLPHTLFLSPLSLCPSPQHRQIPARRTERLPADLHILCYSRSNSQGHPNTGTENQEQHPCPSPIHTFCGFLKQFSPPSPSLQHQQAFLLNTPAEQGNKTGNSQSTHSEKPERKQTKGQNFHPTKTNAEISSQTYNYHKSRCLDACLRTQSRTARAICLHQSSAILPGKHKRTVGGN